MVVDFLYTEMEMSKKTYTSHQPSLTPDFLLTSLPMVRCSNN